MKYRMKLSLINHQITVNESNAFCQLKGKINFRITIPKLYQKE